MQRGLGVAHRLLLIYLLGFVSVAFLGYSLVVEKNRAIELARRELSGSAYVSTVRDVLLAITDHRQAASPVEAAGQAGDGSALRQPLAALTAAQRRYGSGMGTTALAERLAFVMQELTRQHMRDPAAQAALGEAATAARSLITRIGDESGLIVDPELDSYYTMSVVVLRLPEIVTTAADLADAAIAVRPGTEGYEDARARFLLSEGAFIATTNALVSDVAAAYRANRDGRLQENLGSSFIQAEGTLRDFSRALREMAISRQSVDANPIAVRAMLRRTLTASSEFWRQAGGELDRLLQQRVDRLYERMAIDLGAAALVSLLMLGLMLLVARQITRPIRELATVADRVRRAEDYKLRAGRRAGGEIATLVDGFNAMLDRLQRDTAREQERVARDRAAAAQRRLLEAITYAATRIVGTTDWQAAVPELLKRLGLATDVSRVFLFEIHPAPDGTGLAQSCRVSWSAPEIEAMAGDARYQNDPITDGNDRQFDEWFRRRAQGEVIQVTLSQTHGEARKLFEETQTYSMLSVPIMVDGRLWGSLGFDDCRSERVWNDVEIDLLKTATALIAGAIERAQGDQMLRDRENELIEAQRIAHVGSWELDFATDRVTWSDEGWRIFGLDPIARSAWTHDENLEHIHPEDRARVAEVDAHARERGGPFDIEYRVVRPGGEVRIVRERAEPIYDAAGRPVRLLGTVHDITELKQTEAKLRESEERYALAARGADVGLWDWDLAKDRVYFSPRVHEILGVSGQALGTSIAGLFEQIVAEDRAKLQQHFDSRFAKQRRRFDFDFRVGGGPAGIRWMIIRGLIVYADGRPARLVGSLRDITDRKLAQEELIRQRETIYQNEKMAMFGSLLAGVAHELNNPLSVVIGQVVLMQQTASDPAVISRAERIRSATERCARIVRTFLAMARQRQPEPKPVRLNGVVETVLDLLAYQLRSADIRVALDLAADLPTVTADADQLHQVVTNLIVNARQALAATASPRRLSIATRHDTADGRVHLSVADNGPGVPGEIRPRIFEPFFTTKPAGEGTGIGLSLCSSIIRAYGGEISLADTPGGGATFTIMLPLHAGGAVTQRDARTESVLAGLRVLVVDDEKEIAETLSEILRDQGHMADVAPDGQRALERVLADDYDLILSDLRMPLLDGPGLHRALRQRRPAMIERLAFITGDTLSADIQSFLAESRAPCLEKPFLPEDVRRLVRQLMGRAA
ncbi:MAG TPA: ATP-binding protein [Dongiaceae bacterium]|nr:ATP-binding protein [Dongiaceae bacterium]